MKKSCAVKLLAVALVLILTMSTGLSAMAASVTSLTRYNGDVVDVTTQVTGLDEESMVTYLVTDNTSLAATTDSTIKAIDQVNVGDKTAVDFSYTTTSTAIDTDKIYVGADTWNAAVESGKVISANGANVTENGMALATPHAANMNLIAEEGDATAVALTNATSDKVAYVTINDVEVDFAVKDADEIYVFDALSAEDIINVGYKAPYITAASIIDAMPETLERETHFVASNNGAKSGTVGTLNAIQFQLDETGSYGDALKSWYPTTEEKVVNFTAKGSTIKKIFSGKVESDGSVKLNDKTGTGACAANGNVVSVVKSWDAAEVEAMDDATSYTIPTPIAAGKDWVIHIGSNNTLDFEMDVPVAGTYTMAFHVGAYSKSRVPVVSVNGAAAQNATLYSQYQADASGDVGTIAVLEVTLNKGTNTFAVKNTSSVLRFDSAYILNKDSVGQATIELMSQNRANTTRPAGLDKVTGYTRFADTVVSLGKVVRTENSVTVFARVTGSYDECGIELGANSYRALAVGSSENLDTKGAYAIELYSEDAAAINALVGQSVMAYAYDGDDYYTSVDSKLIQ